MPASSRGGMLSSVCAIWWLSQYMISRCFYGKSWRCPILCKGSRKKLLVTLNFIGTQHAAATEATNEAVNQMLDYLATYLNDGIV